MLVHCRTEGQVQEIRATIAEGVCKAADWNSIRRRRKSFIVRTVLKESDTRPFKLDECRHDAALTT